MSQARCSMLVMKVLARASSVVSDDKRRNSKVEIKATQPDEAPKEPETTEAVVAGSQGIDAVRERKERLIDLCTFREPCTTIFGG